MSKEETATGNGKAEEEWERQGGKQGEREGRGGKELGSGTRRHVHIAMAINLVPTQVQGCMYVCACAQACASVPSNEAPLSKSKSEREQRKHVRKEYGT